MEDEQVEVRNTRTGSSRKIDEWTIRIPGGKRIKFNVHLKYEDGTGHFFVSNDDKTYGQINAMSEDINVLKRMLEEKVRIIVDLDRSENWVPATQVEVRHELKDRDHQGIQFQMSLNLQAVEIMPDETRGNYGEATIRTKYAQTVVLEREHATDFRNLRPESGSLTDPEVKAWMASPVSRDQSDGLARVLVEKDQSDPLEIAQVLEAFATLLGERLGPMRVGLGGIPKPEDLIDLMRKAVEISVKIEPETQGDDLDEFRL